jgi:hypothetical protein
MATAQKPFAVPAPRRVLVVGDIMLDRYTCGRADRVSPEAPVLVVQAETCEVRLGGAGAVAGLTPPRSPNLGERLGVSQPVGSNERP